MSYDSWKTTEPDPYEWEECCPECKRLVTQCTCECSDDDEPCKSDGTPIYRSRPLTRQERLQGLADHGIDTWREYHDAFGKDED